MQKNTTFKLNILYLCMIVACVFICVISVCFALAPEADAAANDTYLYTGTAVSNLNVRSGPGTDYRLIRTISAGTTFRLSGEQYNDGVRVYWRLYGEAEELVTGGTYGSNLTVKVSQLTTYTDTIKGYAVDGSIPWEHTCTQSVPEWNYHIEVGSNSYRVICDCGWYYERNPWEDVFLPEDGYDDFVFLGLDTDNNEICDLKPGQTIDLPCRANNDYRPYLIAEFLGSTANDPPTVTVGFFDVDGNELGKYTFNWWADIHVESHGIVMVDMNGKRLVHPVYGEFMLWYDFGEYYLDENPRRMKHGSLFGAADIWEDGRHVEYRFTIKMVTNEDMSPLDWVVYWSKQIGNWVSDVFNFFGLGELLYSADSPFTQILSFDGVQSFFATISDFFSGLPPELVTVISLGFVGAIVIGLVRWFL